MKADIPYVLPATYSKRYSGGPSYSTSVTNYGNGSESRQSNWAQPRREWDISYGIKTDADMAAIEEFWHAALGRGRTFLFWDHRDHKAENQAIGVGDGVERDFALTKFYGLKKMPNLGHTRRIWAPNVSSIRISVNGQLKAAGWNWNVDSQVIHFTTAPAVGDVITAACEFYSIVRFNTDVFSPTYVGAQNQEWSGISLIEVLPDEEIAL